MKSNIFIIILAACLAGSYTVSAQDATTLYNEGLQLKDAKKPKEALEKFKQAASLKADYTEALYESGWCLNDLKDYKGAIINLRKARVGWPAVPKVYFELAYAFEKNDQTDSAITNYNRCLELKPDYSNAFKQLGYIAYNKEDYTTTLGKFKKYEETAKTEIKDYLYWYRRGFTHNALKEYSDAKIYLQKSLSFKTDYINTYLELGFASTKLKQDDEAIGHFKKAMEIDPKNHVSYNGIGEVYRDNKKDMNEAMAWDQKTLAIKENERKACYGMGYCLNSTGKYNEAIAYLKKAIENESGYTAAYVELGYSHYKTDRYTEALEYLNKAVRLNLKNENARYYAAMIYIKQKNKEMAQKMVDELKVLSSKQVAELQKKVDGM